MTPDRRIAIIGAGAAGLSAAWFLKKRGYRHVTVFERSDRIGGKCKSLTFKGRSFDLGANYITSSYARVRQLASELGMGMFTEGKGHALNPANGKLSSLLSATTKRYGLFRVGLAALRYLFLRWRMRKLLTPVSPGFLAASREPELCGPFRDWLEKHGLAALEPVFNIPVTLMGYDKLKQVPAAYALTYMNPRTFLNLMMFALDPPFRQWPKRFHLGYERLWERAAAHVDVLRGADIERIERGERIEIHYKLEATRLTGTELDRHVDTFDALILACPLLCSVLSPFLKLTDEETELFSKVELDPFVVTTYPTSCSTPVPAVAFMFPRPDLGHPYVITQQFGDVPLLSVYSRIDSGEKITRADVLANNLQTLRLIGADHPEAELYSYDEFPYFPHVSCDAMGDGFYRKLESLQGVKQTYYAGGLLAFELVEPIVEYSHHLVATHFGGNQ